MWLVFELDSLFDQRPVRFDDVCHRIVDDRAHRRMFRRLRRGEHQSHPSTIEESETRWSGEQEFHAEHIAIECRRAIDVAHTDRNLSYSVWTESRREIIHGLHGSPISVKSCSFPS